MARTYTLVRKRLMPVEGGIRHLPGIEMYGNSIPAGTVGGDILEYINFQQRYDIDALIERALKRSKEYLEALPPGTPPRNAVDAHIQQRRGALVAETSRMASTQCLRPVWRGTLPGPADEDALVLWALLACALLVLTQLSLLANSIEKSLRRVNFHALAHPARLAAGSAWLGVTRRAMSSRGESFSLRDQIGGKAFWGRTCDGSY